MTTGRPLEGFRILDFCWIGAGALVTKTLAELGASVYRVESRQHPDNLRLSPPFRPGTEGIEASGYFASRNSSKRSIALNMATEEGRALALQLAERVDMVSSNFRPGIMDRWGMSYEQLSAANPGLIYLTMPMQGADGPHARYIGFGSTIAALSGLVALSGIPGRAPVGTGTHFPDHVPNPGHALVAVLAAIRHLRRTGEGQQIELSQLESTVNVLGPAVVEVGLGQAPQPAGNRVADAAPHGAYRCRDGAWVVVSCRSDEQWHALVRALGIPATDGMATLAGRKAEETAIDALVASAIERFDRTELLGLLDAAGVPNAPVNSSRDIVEEKALWERGFWRDIEHPVIGRIPINRSPFRLVDGPEATVTRPPLLGEDTDAVLGSELGLDRAELDRLAAAKVLY
jgi:benzylsuccinate CoA-transferase BbsF subunit